MSTISRATLERNSPFIAKIVKSPPEKWDEKLIEAYRLIELRLAAHCPEAQQELQEFGEIATALRATSTYQERAR
jgi:hypothetical protein